MDILEAVGIRFSNIDEKTGEKLSHEAVYSRIIEYLGGLDVVARCVPFKLPELMDAYAKDEHFNNLPLRIWDKAAGFDGSLSGGTFIHGSLWDLFARHSITTASNTECVCLLKEAARQMVMRRRGELMNA